MMKYKYESTYLPKIYTLYVLLIINLNNLFRTVEGYVKMTTVNFIMNQLLITLCFSRDVIWYSGKTRDKSK